jgi:hypothetical protein
MEKKKENSVKIIRLAESAHFNQPPRNVPVKFQVISSNGFREKFI